MKCPKCGMRNYHCIDTRNVDDIRVRKYQCNSCNSRIKTEERIVGLKVPDGIRFAPVGDGIRVDGREILNALRKPMADLRQVLRKYDLMLK